MPTVPLPEAINLLPGVRKLLPAMDGFEDVE